MFKDPLKLPQELMDEFRKQKVVNQIPNNFRIVQPLNGRTISANFGSHQESTGGSSSPKVSTTTTATTISNQESTGRSYCGSSSPKVFWATLGINAIALTFLIG